MADRGWRFQTGVIYAMWAEQNAMEWKRDPDELKSAQILLDEFTAPDSAPGQKEPLYSVEQIPLTPQPGFTAIAFALPKLLREVGGRVRELSLDSAWNTNGSRYEVYALLGEVYGPGMPLGYLLVQSTPESAPGVRALVTLTDKDWAGINAFLAKYPEAKHQLCFWHALRAIKTRLAILRRVPAHYAVATAHAEFSWIDEKFVPISQSQEVEPDTYVASQAFPQLKVRFNGVPVSVVPRTSDTQPSLTLRLNGTVRAIIPRPDYSSAATNEVPEPESTEDSLEGDLLEEVEQFLNKDLYTDAEDGPDWMFEAGETKSADPLHVFCPAPHRKPLLRIFTKHFCSALNVDCARYGDIFGHLEAIQISLEERTLSTDAHQKYITCVDTWTCTCGSQPLNSCHLCKHLVDAVGHPPPRFWTEMVRRRTLPLYRHPCLVPRGEEKAQYIEPTDGSISDGDDHAWSTDPKVLAGDGGWQNLDFSTSSLLGERERRNSDSSSSADMEEIQRQFFPSFDAHHSDDEEQLDDYAAHLSQRATELEQAAAMFHFHIWQADGIGTEDQIATHQSSSVLDTIEAGNEWLVHIAVVVLCPRDRNGNTCAGGELEYIHDWS
ncbi:hypothetical protein B0H13DRAFT_2375936 [Mycena leptocephala]|nr:hypothetical protein B0H13DRAFT_2375936 [Mycena leptocephala]